MAPHCDIHPVQKLTENVCALEIRVLIFDDLFRSFRILMKTEFVQRRRCSDHRYRWFIIWSCYFCALTLIIWLFSMIILLNTYSLWFNFVGLFKNANGEAHLFTAPSFEWLEESLFWNEYFVGKRFWNHIQRYPQWYIVRRYLHLWIFHRLDS